MAARKKADEITEEATTTEAEDTAPKATTKAAPKSDSPRIGPTGSKNYRIVKGERVYV